MCAKEEEGAAAGGAEREEALRRVADVFLQRVHKVQQQTKPGDACTGGATSPQSRIAVGSYAH